jgi:hypothetical protein
VEPTKEETKSQIPAPSPLHNIVKQDPLKASEDSWNNYGVEVLSDDDFEGDDLPIFTMENNNRKEEKTLWKVVAIDKDVVPQEGLKYFAATSINKPRQNQ